MKKILLLIIVLLLSCTDPTGEKLPIMITIQPTTQVTMNSATIKFQVSEKSNAKVLYGTSKNLELDPVDMATPAINGEVTLTNLTANTLYAYKIMIESAKWDKKDETDTLAFLTPSTANPFDGKISEAKGSVDGKKTIEGIIIDNGVSDYKNVYIQDDLTGIQLRVDQGINQNTFKIGHKIRATGSISRYNDAVQLFVSDTNSIELLDNGAINNIYPITTGNFFISAVHGKLAKFNIVAENSTDNWRERTNYTFVDEHGDKITVRINKINFEGIPQEKHIAGKTIGKPKSITGVVYNYKKEIQVYPRTIDDIEY
jgi:hypothetical protein